jgi:hypothetical protein
LTEALVQISEKSCRNSENRFGIETALAQYVRGRWPQNTIGETANHFDLSEGQARGAVYAQASRKTINDMLRVGGWPLWLHVGALVIGHGIHTWIHTERERLADEQRKASERDRTLAEMGSRLPVVLGLDDRRSVRVASRGRR